MRDNVYRTGPLTVSTTDLSRARNARLARTVQYEYCTRTCKPLLTNEAFRTTKAEKTSDCSMHQVGWDLTWIRPNSVVHAADATVPFKSCPQDLSSRCGTTRMPRGIRIPHPVSRALVHAHVPTAVRDGWGEVNRCCTETIVSLGGAKIAPWKDFTGSGASSTGIRCTLSVDGC